MIPKSPALKLYDLLNLKLCDADDEALIAFHKLMTSQYDDLQSGSARIATSSKGIRIESNPVWIYLSSALTLKIGEMRERSRTCLGREILLRMA